MSLTRKERDRLQKALGPCPFCGELPRLVQSDGGDCRISRECRAGYYIKCWKCDLLFGYESDRGGVWDEAELEWLVRDWNQSKARPRRVLTLPYQITWAAARVNAGLTQGQVGAKIGTHATTISHWEVGRINIPKIYRLVLAKLYGVKPEWIKEETK